MPGVSDIIAQNSWCLYLSNRHTLPETLTAYADDLASKARFDVSLKINLDAPFSVAFVDEETRRSIYDFPTPVEYLTSSERIVSASYTDIRDAEILCVVMMDGWKVIGQDGEIYPLSCTPMAFEMFSTIEPDTGSVPEMTINVRAPQ